MNEPAKEGITLTIPNVLLHAVITRLTLYCHIGPNHEHAAAYFLSAIHQAMARQTGTDCALIPDSIVIAVIRLRVFDYPWEWIAHQLVKYLSQSQATVLNREGSI
jgi:hypothetical protein